MYIKLGTIGVNYYTPPIDDFMIFSEVPDSTLSYESPVIIRTLEELNIWFGKTASDYSNLCEILRNGGHLYLYRPVSIVSTTNTNIAEWPERYFDNTNKVPFPVEFLSADPFYDLNGEALNTHPFPQYKYNVNGEWYIWKDDTNSWISEKELPQNAENMSVSLNNHDTLLIASKPYNYNSSKSILWFGDSEAEVGDLVYTMNDNGVISLASDGNYSSYTIEDGKFYNISEDIVADRVIKKTFTANPEYDHETRSILPVLESDYRLEDISVIPETPGNTFTLHLYFPNPNASLGNGYLRYKTSSGVSKIFTFGDTNESNLGYGFVGNGDIVVPGINTVSDLKERLLLEGLQILEDGDTELILVTENGKRSEFNNIFSSTNPDIEVENDEWINNLLIYKHISELNLESAFFCSKTIGRDSSRNPERDITLEIENLSDSEIRVKISRYGYSEYFVGKLNATLGEERLDHIITRDSKLTRCWLLKGIEEVPQNTGLELEDGTYTLIGAWEETYESANYLQALKVMFDIPGDEVCPDFFMIPKLNLWGDVEKENRDLLFLNYAKKYNIQFLISENTKSEAIGNIIDDKENRLIYFYGDLKVNDVSLPAYYPFIMGVLTNSSVYTAKYLENDLIWENNQKLKINPYNTEVNELDQYKCNYLVCNNQRYYYRKYNSGPNYETTAWRRFIIGKVYRELEKNKWDYLGTRFNAIIKNRIEDILYRIEQSFSMVRRIEISSYTPIPRMNLIDLVIDVHTTDLVDNDIKLDITINYNKQNG